MVPDAGWPSPASTLVSVVLPAPLRPTSPTRSPSATRKLACPIRTRAPPRSSTSVAVLTEDLSRGADVGGWAAASAGRSARSAPSLPGRNGRTRVPATGRTGMSFNDDAGLDTSQVTGGGGRGPGLAIGGGVGGLLILVISLFFGGNLTGGGNGVDPGVSDPQA